jgi:hypothetical protein
MLTISKRLAVILALAGAGVVWTTATFVSSAGNSANPAKLMTATVSAAAPALTASPARTYRDVTIPAGTRIKIRLNSSLASNTSRVEDPVNATIISPIVVRGTRVVPAGSRVRGVVSTADDAGRVKGRARLGFALHEIRVGSGAYPISAGYLRVAPATKMNDAKKIALPAAGGALIGGLWKGKKGALVGTAIGGGAGTALVLSTKGKEVVMPSGSTVSLTLRRAVTVRVPA